MVNLLPDFMNWRCKVARCKFPGPSIARTFKAMSNKSSCDQKARYEITFQGRRISVCKVHKQYDGRDRIV